ncbi:helicase associated domain-containing protein [Streptomyces sp. NPDC057611]|uniref:helicase associated domain-containing protein n=1 Tax=Streptomyces sp. NPDC057611 TaxID=3346182 RepID=UPI0036A86DB1
MAHATAHAAHHGHLAVPVDHLHDDFPLGRWLATQRTRAHDLTAERTAALTALDPWWNPPWPITWQRAYHAARRQTEQDAAAAPAGEWLTAQRQRVGRLHPEQRRLLENLGLDLPDAAASRAKNSLLPARERAFERALAAARAFRQREGHLHVPQWHIEEIDGEQVRLGQWLSNLRRRRSSLTTPNKRRFLDLWE